MPYPRSFLLTLLLPALATAAGCDDAVGPTEVEPLASGFRVSAEGSVLASASGRTASGMLQVEAGGESPVLEVEFLDRSGQPVTPGPGLALGGQVHVEEVATFRGVSPSAFSARLRGVRQGTTTARFYLLQDGRAEYISPPVEVRVVPP